MSDPRDDAEQADEKDGAERAIDDVQDFLEPDDERPAGQDMPADADPSEGRPHRD